MASFGFFERIRTNSMLMDAMLARLGVREWFAVNANGPQILRRAALRCIGCTHSRECAAWLAANERPDRAPDFCRNRDLTDRIAQAIRRPA